MASLEEAIALDIARKLRARVHYRQIARDILQMQEIREGLELREAKQIEAAGRGL